MSTTVARCTICDADSLQPWRLGLLQCGGCGVILSPATWQPQVNERMEEEWFGDDQQSRESAWTLRFETWNNRRTISRLHRSGARGGSLLEIGVGSGSFLVAARECGYEVMGVDLSAPICDRVRRQHGIAMHCGFIAELIGTRTFDVIIMNHVLEHVAEPVEFMREVRALLSDDGIVHVAVPNVACWEAALRGWTSYEPYHLTYFAPDTLRRAIERAGLAVQTMTARDSFSGWFLAALRTALGVNRRDGAVVRTSGAVAGTSTRRRGTLVEAGYRTAMIVSGVALWPLRRAQTLLAAGDELVCVARKAAGAQRG